MLRGYLVTYIISGVNGSRKQTDYFNANNPDDACAQAIQHVKTVYPLLQTKIVRVAIERP
jgi:hypothetical protein